MYLRANFPSITIGSRIGLQFTLFVIASDLKKTRVGNDVIVAGSVSTVAETLIIFALTWRRLGLAQDGRGEWIGAEGCTNWPHTRRS